MTDRLRDLLARVEAATGPDRELDGRLWCMARAYEFIGMANGPCGSTWVCYRYPPHDREYRHSPENFTSSLDAALALVERVLPGWSWQVAGYHETGAYAILWPNTEKTLSSDGATPPLALLTALLKALSGLQEQAEVSPTPAEEGHSHD